MSLRNINMDIKTTKNELLEILSDAIQSEIEGLQELLNKISDKYILAVQSIDECKGRIIITGIGKMGIIGRKIAATFVSLGIPAIFLHPTEAAHGDLGIIGKSDLSIMLSNSGETEEIIYLIPFFKRIGIQIISFTGNPNSTLAKYSDIIIDIGVSKEACPLNCAPMASTTNALVMGDALAVALIKKRNITKEMFANNHPGGILGKKLFTRVEDIMRTGDELPVVNNGYNLTKAIEIMTSKCLGCVFIVDDKQMLMGIITDGDLRRIFQKYNNPLELDVTEIMISNPKIVRKDILVSEALNNMEGSKITVFPVVNDYMQLIGAIHMHDILREGIS